jgi:organic hydroperoxide reductase OsmC/OhrA
MIRYPLYFSSEVQSGTDASSPWSVSASGNQATCAIPKEFGGTGGALSPEDFFLLALSNCFLATFKVYSNASHHKFSSIKIQAKLELEKDPQNQPFAKNCHLQVYVGEVEDPSRTLAILKKVARSGILLNSVKTQLSFDFEINGEKVS